MALMGVICAAGLSSCGDDDSSWCGHKHVAVEQPAADEEKHETPDQTVEAQQKELLDYMIFTIGDKVRQQAAQPMWREDVRDMRNKLEAYLTHLKETGADAMTIVRLGLLLADATRDMAAYSRAEGLYQDTLKDLDALPEDVRAGVPARRIRSALSNGIGSCYLMQRKFTEALPHYEEALRLDKELYDSLAPADGQPLPEGEEMSDDLAQDTFLYVLINKKSKNVKFIITLTQEENSNYLKGRINKEMIAEYLKEFNTIFMCGPKELYQAMNEILSEFHIPKKSVHFENFSTSYNALDKKEYELKVILKNDFVLTTCKSDETLLTSLEKAGIKAPSLCRVGMCGFCKSILLEGKIKMVGNNMSKAESEHDYIHPCVSYPESDIVLRLDI